MKNMESMKVTSRHMCFTPKCLKNSKRGVLCTHLRVLISLEQQPSKARGITESNGTLYRLDSMRFRKPNEYWSSCDMV